MISLRLNDLIHPNGQGVVWSWPSRVYSYLTDYVEVTVEQWRSGDWLVKVYLDVRLGPMWGLTRRFETQAAAAVEAADAWSECVRIVHAWWRGEPLRTPSDLMAGAFSALPSTISAEEHIHALTGERWAIDYESPMWAGRRRDQMSKEQAATEDLRQAREAWFQVQDWRAHRDGIARYLAPEQVQRGQLVLAGCG